MPDAPRVVPLKPRHAAKPKASSTARGYGTAHRKARQRLLAEHPLCQLCGRAWATDLHHLDHDVHNRHPSNLMVVCERCHHEDLHGSR